MLFGAAKKKFEIPKPGEIAWPFRLGDRVRDKLNGLEGTAIIRLFHITGCDRFTVELDAKDGAPGGEFTVDANRLELVKSQPEFHRDELPGEEVALGDKVRDLINGLTGRVTVIIVPLHGAIRVNVEPGYIEKDKKMAEAWCVDAHTLEVIEPFNKPEPVAKPAETNAKEEPTPKPKKARGHSRLGRSRY